MRETDIRRLLIETIAAAHDEPTLIVEELGVLHGRGRVDVAAVNGSLSGYEIKSAQDDLKRLPRQVALYSEVMDDMTLVVDEKHLADAVELVPDCWGLLLAEASDHGLKELRRAEPNTAVDPRSVLHLLWKDELVETALVHGRPDARRRTKAELIEWLAVIVEIDEIRSAVRLALTSRKGWPVQRSLA